MPLAHTTQRNKDQSKQGMQHRFRESPLSCNLQRKFREVDDDGPRCRRRELAVADEDGQAKVHVELVDVQVRHVEDHAQQVGVGAALIVGEVHGCPAITAEPMASLAPQASNLPKSRTNWLELRTNW